MPLKTSDEILERLFHLGGSIVSSNDCSQVEIGMAKAGGRFYMLENGYTFVLRAKGADANPFNADDLNNNLESDQPENKESPADISKVMVILGELIQRVELLEKCNSDDDPIGLRRKISASLANFMGDLHCELDANICEILDQNQDAEWQQGVPGIPGLYVTKDPRRIEDMIVIFWSQKSIDDCDSERVKQTWHYGPIPYGPVIS